MLCYYFYLNFFPYTKCERIFSEKLNLYIFCRVSPNGGTGGDGPPRLPEKLAFPPMFPTVFAPVFGHFALIVSPQLDP